MPRPRLSDKCTVDGCDGEYRCLGLCKRHYSELQRRRIGIPEREPAKKKRVAPKTRRPKYGPVCTLPDCEKPHRARGLCAYHYNYTYYPPKTDGGKRGKEVVGYRAAHIRVELAKGKAKTHRCVACGNPAQEWSLDPLAVHTYEDGNKVWSLNIDDYDPYCVPCHRERDGGYSWHDEV